MMGKKPISEWPGVPEGWGKMPGRRRKPARPKPGLIPSVLSWLRGLMGALGFSSAPRLRNPDGIAEIRSLMMRHYGLFGMSAEELVEAIRNEYKLDQVMTLALTLAYVEETLRREGKR